jgi:isopenicillin N synthase-like dioxygenase
VGRSGQFFEIPVTDKRTGEKFQSPIWWGVQVNGVGQLRKDKDFRKFQSPIWWGVQVNANLK